MRWLTLGAGIEGPSDPARFPGSGDGVRAVRRVPDLVGLYGQERSLGRLEVGSLRTSKGEARSYGALDASLLRDRTPRDYT